MENSADLSSFANEIPEEVEEKWSELRLFDRKEKAAFHYLFCWFLNQRVLSLHALRYCCACVEVLGTLDVMELADAVLHRVNPNGTPLVSLSQHLQVTILDESKIIKGLSALVAEKSAVDIKEPAISRQMSDATASSLFSLSTCSGKSSLPLSNRHLSSPTVPDIAPADLILVSVASPSTIRTRLAYLFAYPNYHHCFSTTLLLRHCHASLHDEQQGQGLTGLLLATHCGRRFYTQDAGLFQHLPRLLSTSITRQENVSDGMRENPTDRYHPYYQSYDFDDSDRRQGSLPSVRGRNMATVDEARSLPPDARCVPSDLEAMRLLSRTSNNLIVDVGLHGLIPYIQRSVPQTATVATGCLNEVGAVVRSPTDIIGLFYYWQPHPLRPVLPGRGVADVRQQAKEVALQFGLQLYHLQVQRPATYNMHESNGSRGGADWFAEVDSA